MSLDDVAKVHFLYFITNAHVNSSGVYHLPDGYACADLRCDLEQYRRNRAILIDAKMIDWDEECSLILVERWFKHNGPMSEDHATGTMRFLNTIESDRLREKAVEAFHEANERRREKAAEKRADQERKAAERTKITASMVGVTSNLMKTRMMGGERA
jgi:hypothetical protein